MTAPMTDPFAAFETPGASYIDPTTGRQIQGARSAPAGTPYYQSSQLVRNPVTGATASATGTAENPFAGFVGAQGGTFGSTPETAANRVQIDPTGANSGGYYHGPDTGEGYVNGQAVPAGMTNAQMTSQVTAKEGVANALSTPGLSLGNGSQAWWNSLSPDFQKEYLAQGGTGANADALKNLSQGMNADGSKTMSTQDYLAAHPDQTAAAINAKNAANDAVVSAPVDADPFGQFDDPAHPTHGVITPQYEKTLADQAQAKLLASTAPGAVPPSAGASATTPAASTPPAAGAANVNIQAPTLNPNDPFAPFVDPLTGQPNTGPATPAQAQIAPPTFTASY